MNWLRRVVRVWMHRVIDACNHFVLWQQRGQGGVPRGGAVIEIGGSLHTRGHGELTKHDWSRRTRKRMGRCGGERHGAVGCVLNMVGGLGVGPVGVGQRVCRKMIINTGCIGGTCESVVGRISRNPRRRSHNGWIGSIKAGGMLWGSPFRGMITRLGGVLHAGDDAQETLLLGLILLVSRAASTE